MHMFNHILLLQQVNNCILCHCDIKCTLSALSFTPYLLSIQLHVLHKVIIIRVIILLITCMGQSLSSKQVPVRDTGWRVGMGVEVKDLLENQKDRITL